MRGVGLGIMMASAAAAGGASTIDTRQLLIDSFASADRYYVDTTGSDSNDGSSGSPWLTRAHAVSQVSAGKCIIYGAGEFAATNQNHGSLHELMCGTDYDGITHIGTPNGTVFTESADNAQRDNPIIGTGDPDTLFAFIRFKRDNNARTDSYKVAVLCNEYSVAAKGKAFNCVFEEVNANGKMSLSYNNSGTSVFELANCLFIASDWLEPTGSAETGITVKNCAATSVANYGTTSTTENNIDDVTLDADYRFVLDAGVYSGTNDWDDAAARQTLIDSFAVADRIYVETTGDDVSGDGSISSPYETLDHAIAQAASGDIIILGTGIFDKTVVLTDSGYGGQYVMWGPEINGMTILCKPDTVIKNIGTVTSSNRFGIYGSTDANTELIGGEHRVENITSAEFEMVRNSNATNCFGATKNVYINITSGTHQWCRNDSGGTQYTVERCTINSTWVSGESSPSGAAFQYNAVVNTYDVGTGTTDTGNISNVTIDAEYRLVISQGVYSGFYNWDGWNGQGQIDLDGADDYLEAAAHADFAFGTGEFSLYAVLTFDALSERYLFGPGGRGSTSGYDDGWGVRFDPSRGLCFFDPAGAGGSTEAYCAWSPVIGTRYRILITRNSSNEIDMWIGEGSGALVQQTVTNDNRSEDIGCTLNLRIGHSANSNTSYEFDGQFEEVHVVNGSALADTYYPANDNSPKHANTVLLINPTSAQTPTSFDDLSDSGHTITTSGDTELVA